MIRRVSGLCWVLPTQHWEQSVHYGDGGNGDDADGGNGDDADDGVGRLYLLVWKSGSMKLELIVRDVVLA